MLGLADPDSQHLILPRKYHISILARGDPVLSLLMSAFSTRKDDKLGVEDRHDPGVPRSARHGTSVLLMQKTQTDLHLLELYPELVMVNRRTTLR